jgi:hypothetical protein
MPIFGWAFFLNPNLKMAREIFANNGKTYDLDNLSDFDKMTLENLGHLPKPVIETLLTPSVLAVVQDDENSNQNQTVIATESTPSVLAVVEDDATAKRSKK